MASSHLKSFLRESGKLYTLYMVAGLAAIPAGVLYAIIDVRGYGSWWTALLAIALGVGMAKLAWDYADRIFFAPHFTASGASTTWCPVPAAAAVVIVLSLQLTVTTAQQSTAVSVIVTMDQPYNALSSRY